MQNYLKSAKNFLAGSIAESKKVTWPTKKQLFDYSVIVVGAIAVCLAVMAALDFGFTFMVEHYILGI